MRLRAPLTLRLSPRLQRRARLRSCRRRPLALAARGRIEVEYLDGADLAATRLKEFDVEVHTRAAVEVNDRRLHHHLLLHPPELRESRRLREDLGVRIERDARDALARHVGQQLQEERLDAEAV